MCNVLVLRLSALGDVAMTVPVIYSAARQHPEVRFTVVTRPFFRRLFIDAHANVDFIDFDPRGPHKGVRGLLTLIRELKARKFTAVADLHDILRTRMIRTALHMQGIPVATVNKDRRARKQLTRLKERTFQENYVDRYADVFRRLGLPVEVNFSGFYQSDEPRRGVGIAPFARYQTKTYPPELMEQVARSLTDAGISVTLFGARGQEQEELAKWVERNPALTSLAGKLTIEEELRAMSRLQVMVTMDSANMHLASLVATPVVSVWGSTIPQCGFLGYGQSADRAVWLDLPCQPCSVAGLPKCPPGHCDCLRRLAPSAITARVKACL